MEQRDTTPWYRQFWPWFIVLILGWGVVSSSITLSVALKNPPHMMTGDYEKLGKALVDTHARADRAEALGLAGRLTAEGGEWQLQLDPNAAELPGEQLLLLVQHPTDSARDRQAVLSLAPSGEYRAAAVEVPTRGRLIVSDLEQTWWISGRYESMDAGRTVALKPERL